MSNTYNSNNNTHIYKFAILRDALYAGVLLPKTFVNTLQGVASAIVANTTWPLLIGYASMCVHMMPPCNLQFNGPAPLYM